MAKIRSPYNSFIECKPNATDLLQTIAAYQGERTIILPKTSNILDITDKITISTDSFDLVNKPPRSAQIRLAAGGYFSIENADNLDYGSFKFRGLKINGNTTATRAISTENMGAGKRARYLKVRDCMLYGFDAANAVAIKGKNPELWEIAHNHLATTKTALIDLYEDSYNYGNVWIHHNFMYCFSGANAGLGLRIQQITANKNPVNIVSHHNQYYGGTSGSPNSLAIQAVLTNDDVSSIVSDCDRFEGLRVFSPSIMAGTLWGLKIVNSPSILYNAAFDVELVELLEPCHASIVTGNLFERGGGNAIIGVRDENTGTGDSVNRVGGNTFKYFNHAGSGSSYLTKAIGAITIEDPVNIFTP